MKERRERAEKERLESQLRKDQPEFVKNFHFEFDEDLDGDPAVSVWAIVGDGEAESADFPEHLKATRSWISTALSQTEIEHWPYVQFRAESEVDWEKIRAHEVARVFLVALLMGEKWKRR